VTEDAGLVNGQRFGAHDEFQIKRTTGIWPMSRPQGFRPGLRTVAPIRGLKTSFQLVEIFDHITVLVLDTYLFFKLLNLQL
jgi:hypothetical protein